MSLPRSTRSQRSTPAWSMDSEFSIAPWSALKEAGGEVVAVPFGEPPIYRQICLIERRASPRAAVIDRLHQHLVSFSGEFRLTR